MINSIFNFLRNRKNNFFVTFKKYKDNNFEYNDNIICDHIEVFNDLSNWEIGHPVNGIGDEVYNKSNQINDINNIRINPVDLYYTKQQSISFCVNKINKILDNGHVIKKSNSSIFRREPLSYGIYKWNLNFPKGDYINPYISLINTDTYPPEIKVISGYSNNKDYFSIGSEVLYGYNKENIKSAGYIEHKRTIYNEFMCFEIKLDWSKDYIRIYYNGYLVNEVTSKRVLKFYNMNPKMHIVMGCNHINNRPSKMYSLWDYKFNVYNFIYYKVKE